MSHRSGEAEDATIADLAVTTLRSNQNPGLCRALTDGKNPDKLIRIEEEDERRIRWGKYSTHVRPAPALCQSGKARFLKQAPTSPRAFGQVKRFHFDFMPLKICINVSGSRVNPSAQCRPWEILLVECDKQIS